MILSAAHVGAFGLADAALHPAAQLKDCSWHRGSVIFGGPHFSRPAERSSASCQPKEYQGLAGRDHLLPLGTRVQ